MLGEPSRASFEKDTVKVLRSGFNRPSIAALGPESSYVPKPTCYWRCDTSPGDLANGGSPAAQCLGSDLGSCGLIFGAAAHQVRTQIGSRGGDPWDLAEAVGLCDRPALARSGADHTASRLAYQQ